MKIFFSSFFVFLFFLTSILLCGCKKASSINIRHETPELAKKIQQKQEVKTVVKKSSGIIIYKDNSTTNATGAGNVHFGPKDLNFDMHIKMH